MSQCTHGTTIERGVSITQHDQILRFLANTIFNLKNLIRESSVVAQVVEYLSTKHKDLSSNCSTAQKKFKIFNLKKIMQKV
jgi:hypothetical protein